MPWFKGNTHTHTTNSDGDAPLEHVARWYADHGYDFLVITDHNRLTSLPGEVAGCERLLLIPGWEYSVSSEGKPVHVNGLNASSLPEFATADTIPAALQMAVDTVRACGATPQINHPNFCWAFTHEQMLSVEGWCLLEILNASTDCNNYGGGGLQGVEEMWDELLSAGKMVYGVAADDTHDYTKEFWGHISPPGQAWVQVRAEELTTTALMQALEAGSFYASTEVELEEVLATPARISLRIRQHYSYRYTTHFVGRGGRVLAEAHGLEPSYEVLGVEGYVRAKVFSSNGGVAWSQPVMLSSSAHPAGRT